MSNFLLNNRAFLRLSGPDAERFLNGQVTQNVSLTTEGRALWTAVTNAKGQIEGVGCINYLNDGSFLFDCPLDIGDEMEGSLDKYLIADDCEWSREDDEWAILVCGEEDGKVSNRFRGASTEKVIKKSDADAVLLPEDLEMEWRVRNGVPSWGLEINKGMLPAECGLYDLALSFNKGCYIGQEIISRMETSGKTRTKLYQVLGNSETVLNFNDFSTFFSNKESKGGLLVSKQSPASGFPSAVTKEF